MDSRNNLNWGLDDGDDQNPEKEIIQSQTNEPNTFSEVPDVTETSQESEIALEDNEMTVIDFLDSNNFLFAIHSELTPPNNQQFANYTEAIALASSLYLAKIDFNMFDVNGDPVLSFQVTPFSVDPSLKPEEREVFYGSEYIKQSIFLNIKQSIDLAVIMLEKPELLVHHYVGKLMHQKLEKSNINKDVIMDFAKREADKLVNPESNSADKLMKALGGRG